MNRILIDTNVMVYFIDEDSKYHKICNELLNSENKIFISSKSLAEFFAVLTRIPDVSVSAKEAIKMVRFFSDSFQIIFPSNKSVEILMTLVEKHQPKGLKIHDYEIMSIGIANKIDTLATFNSRDFPADDNIKILDLKNNT